MRGQVGMHDLELNDLSWQEAHLRSNACKWLLTTISLFISHAWNSFVQLHSSFVSLIPDDWRKLTWGECGRRIPFKIFRDESAWYGPFISALVASEFQRIVSLLHSFSQHVYYSWYVASCIYIFKGEYSRVSESHVNKEGVFPYIYTLVCVYILMECLFE